MEVVHMNFQYYYTDGDPCNHYRDLPMDDIARWMESYKFTHPNCTAITVKVWFNREGK